MRTVILLVVLVFTGLLAAGTVSSAIQRGGPSAIEIFGLLVVALFAFGIVGALRHPPDE